MDRTAANLAKLEAVWKRAEPLIPSGPARGTDPLFYDLQRAWNDLLPGLPPIDGWTISESLPDPDGIGQAYIDYLDIGEIPVSVDEAADQPARDIAEYRHRLNRARQRATRERLRQLVVDVDIALPMVTRGVERTSKQLLSGDQVSAVEKAVAEIERLLGDAVTRQGRWSYLHRHISFGQGQDWHDIVEFDWPSVKADIESAMFAESDPLPVPTY